MPRQSPEEALLNQLRKEISKLDMPVERIAKLLEMHRGNLYRFLRGELTPSLETVGKILKVLDLEVQLVKKEEGGSKRKGKK